MRIQGIFWLTFVLTLGLAIAMSYKKNDQDIYEPDLIPVSSTVIPLHELTVNSENGTASHPKMLSKAAIKRLLSKHQLSAEDPHELITAKKNRRKSRMVVKFISV